MKAFTGEDRRRTRHAFGYRCTVISWVIVVLPIVCPAFKATASVDDPGARRSQGYRVAWSAPHSAFGLCEAIAGNAAELVRVGWSPFDFVSHPLEVAQKYETKLGRPNWKGIEGADGRQIVRDWAEHVFATRLRPDGRLPLDIEIGLASYIPQMAEVDLDGDGRTDKLGRILSRSNENARYWVLLDRHGSMASSQFSVSHGGGFILYRGSAYLVYGVTRDVFVRRMTSQDEQDLCHITDLPERVEFEIDRTWSDHREDEGCSAMTQHLNNRGKMFTYEVVSDQTLHIDALPWSDIEFPRRKDEVIRYLMSQDVKPQYAESYRRRLEAQIRRGGLVAKEAWIDADDDQVLDHVVAVADARIRFAHTFLWNVFIAGNSEANQPLLMSGGPYRRAVGHVYRYRGRLHLLKQRYDSAIVPHFCKIMVSNLGRRVD